MVREAGPDGRWDAAYVNDSKRHPKPYGDTITYAKAAAFLDGLDVEDWGCGLGWMRRFVPADRYKGIDGSRTPFADVVARLSDYRSKTEAVFMRHILEHNWDWRIILRNAVESFRRRMVLVLFTPLGDETRLMATSEFSPGVTIPDLSLCREDLLREISPYLVREEPLRTATQYGVEHMFYLEK